MTTIVLTVLGTVLVTIIGARLNASTEHKRWLRAEKLEAYAALDFMLSTFERTNGNEPDAERFIRTFAAASSKAILVGASFVVEQITEMNQEVVDAYRDGNQDLIKQFFNGLNHESNRLLTMMRIDLHGRKGLGDGIMFRRS